MKTRPKLGSLNETFAKWQFHEILLGSQLDLLGNFRHSHHAPKDIAHNNQLINTPDRVKKNHIYNTLWAKGIHIFEGMKNKLFIVPLVV
jgi:hypothetical protein